MASSEGLSGEQRIVMEDAVETLVPLLWKWQEDGDGIPELCPPGPQSGVTAHALVSSALTRLVRALGAKDVGTALDYVGDGFPIAEAIELSNTEVTNDGQQ